MRCQITCMHRSKLKYTCTVMKLTNVGLFTGRLPANESVGLSTFPEQSWSRRKHLTMGARTCLNFGSSPGSVETRRSPKSFLEESDCFIEFFFIFTVPPRVSVDYDEVPVILGETLVLQCAAVGVPMPTITWVKDDKPLRSNDRVNITDDGALIIGAAIPQDVGEYHCVGRSPAGTDSALVTLWGEGGLCMKGVYSIL